MKKLVLVAVFLLGFSVMAMAQGEAPLMEVFGGYSLVQVDTATAFYDTPGDELDLHLDGWNINVAFNGNKYMGVLVDIGGYYGTLGEDINATAGDETAAVHVHTVMIGPRFTLTRGKVAPFVHALVGVARITASAQDIDTRERETVFKENDFALALGGGIDVNLNDRIAIRPVQLDYLGIKSGQTGNFGDHFRYSAGVVLKLGSR